MNKDIIEFNPNSYPLNPGKRLLEASAGTGKTFSLAHLILRLIAEKELSIRDILVKSFTKATASEIKSKISSRLMLALKGLENIEEKSIDQTGDDVLHEWLILNGQEEVKRIHLVELIMHALEDLDNADITTIHRFCSRNLKREAIEIGCNINSTLLSEKEYRELQHQIVDEYWRDEILSLHPLHLKGLKDAGISNKALLSTLFKIDSDPSSKFEIDFKSINSEHSLSDQFKSILMELWNQFVQLWEEEGAELEEGLNH